MVLEESRGFMDQLFMVDHWKKVFQQHRRMQRPREASSVNPVREFRIQVHKKGWQRQHESPFDIFGGISGTLRLVLVQKNWRSIYW